MKKTVLLVGKDFNEAQSFTGGLKDHDRSLAIAGDKSFTWNKSSPISARTLILQCANTFGSIAETVLYFDENIIAAKFQKRDLQTCSQVNDEYILGYQYLAVELLQRYKNHPGKIAFVYKSLPKTMANANPFVRAAAASFCAFAQATANDLIQSLDSEIIPTVLVKVDAENEQYKLDSALSDWLCSYFDALDDTKIKPDAKHPASWIKPGSKPSAGFAIFH